MDTGSSSQNALLTSPRLRGYLPRGPGDADARIDCNTAGRPCEHRVEVELRDLGKIDRELREAVQEIDEGGAVGGRRSPPTCLRPERSGCEP